MLSMRKVFTLIIGFAIIISCNNEKPSIAKKSDRITTLDGALVLTDSLIYGIATHASENVDSSEIAGFNSFLQGKFIEYIFKKIYEGKLKAYDFLTEEELSIKEVKEIENAEGFNRSKVGKVQFNEQWLIDKNGILIKRVNNMTLGVERYSKQGTFVGYNALFKIKFNTTVQ